MLPKGQKLRPKGAARNAKEFGPRIEILLAEAMNSFEPSASGGKGRGGLGRSQFLELSGELRILNVPETNNWRPWESLRSSLSPRCLSDVYGAMRLAG